MVETLSWKEEVSKLHHQLMSVQTTLVLGVKCNACGYLGFFFLGWAVCVCRYVDVYVAVLCRI